MRRPAACDLLLGTVRKQMAEAMLGKVKSCKRTNPTSQLEVQTRSGRDGRLTAMTSKVWPVFFDSQAEPSRTRICHEPCAMLSKSA